MPPLRTVCLIQGPLAPGSFSPLDDSLKLQAKHFISCLHIKCTKEEVMSFVSGGGEGFPKGLDAGVQIEGGAKRD